MDVPPNESSRPRLTRPGVLALLVAAGVLMLVLIAGAVVSDLRREPAPELPAVLYRIPINEADAGTLQLLPGVGPALAGRIIHTRTAGGPFVSADDLQRVNGIGPTLSQRIAPFVVFEQADETDSR